MEIDLHLGDCLEVMPTLTSESVDAVITSPPYFNAKAYSQFPSYSHYLEWLGEATAQFYRLLKEARILIVNLSCVIQARVSRQSESTRYAIPFHYVGIAESVGFKFVDDIIWKKPLGAASGRGRGFNTHRQPVAYKPFPITEFLLVFKKGNELLDRVIRSHSKEDRRASCVRDDYERSNIWEVNPETRSKHPAPFPLALVGKAIRYYSFAHDTILDPFMGSGTTGVACVNLNRNFIGIEKDPTYLEIAQKRVQEAHTQMPLEISYG